MPYAGTFPYAQLFTSPLAVPCTVGGSQYKCVFFRNDITDELNSENYELYMLVPAATAALLSEGDSVVIDGVTYLVTGPKRETAVGIWRVYLSRADADPTDITVGSELLADTNFSTGDWTKTGDAVFITGLATLEADSTIIYIDTIPLTLGATYRYRITITSLVDGSVSITNQNLMQYIEEAGTHDIYFEARESATGSTYITAHNNSSPILITSVSLKEVL